MSEQSLIFAKNELIMRNATLNPTQMHLLRLFSYNNSESYALEIQKILTQHFQSLLDKESDKLWADGTLDQKRLDELWKEDMHKK